MRRTIDLTGRRYGMALVLSQDVGLLHGEKQSLCRCRCDCGNEFTVPAHKLARSDGTPLPGPHSCGCVRKLPDYTGQRFGAVTALSKAEGRNASGEIIYHCRCDCGTEFITSGSQLKSGFVRSCGCGLKKAQQSFGRYSRLGVEAAHTDEATQRRLATRYPDAEARKAHGAQLRSGAEEAYAIREGVHVAKRLGTEPQSTNPYRGVCWNSSKRRWMGYCQVAGVKWQKCFRSPEEAKEARDKKLAELIEELGVQDLIDKRNEHVKNKGENEK